MPDHRTIIICNEESRGRLKALCSSLYEVDLLRPAGDGWTVAAKLAHLAHQDRQVSLCLDAWERADARRINVSLLIRRTGEWLPVAAIEAWQRIGVDWASQPQRSPAALNEAALSVWRALPAHIALRQAVNTAEVLDARIAALRPRLLKPILASDNAWMVEPHQHRMEHVDDIRRALKSGMLAGTPA